MGGKKEEKAAGSRLFIHSTWKRGLLINEQIFRRYLNASFTFLFLSGVFNLNKLFIVKTMFKNVLNHRFSKAIYLGDVGWQRS